MPKQNLENPNIVDSPKVFFHHQRGLERLKEYDRKLLTDKDRLRCEVENWIYIISLRGF